MVAGQSAQVEQKPRAGAAVSACCPEGESPLPIKAKTTLKIRPMFSAWL
jgi:hypothetical protein